jgi:hypothetical protein
MTRTDVMASSRPQAIDAAPMRRGSTGIMRRLAVVPAVLLLAMALVGPSTAFAAEPTTSGYNQEPNKPSTGTSPSKETGTSPSKETGTSPSKEAGTPTTSTSKEAAPSTSSAKPTSQKASTLPFTGFDLRWSVGAGLLLMGAGFSIVAAQRRQRRESGR